MTLCELLKGNAGYTRGVQALASAKTTGSQGQLQNFVKEGGAYKCTFTCAN